MCIRDRLYPTNADVGSTMDSKLRYTLMFFRLLQHIQHRYNGFSTLADLRRYHTRLLEYMNYDETGPQAEDFSEYSY